MPYRKYQVLLFSGLGLLLLAALLFTFPTTPAQAQCGSQASSCKNCHEVQGQDPVNNDGTGWHVSHAFGDFCYICHAGNNQSMDKATAHTGMVAPLSDIKAACQSCHPNDLDDRAQVYASALGVNLADIAGSSSGGAASTGGGAGQTGEASAPSESSAESEAVEQPAAMVVQSDDVIDYNQRYELAATGRRPVNWGNLILGLMIAGLVAGGGAFVYANERKLRGLPLRKTKTPAKKEASLEAPVVDGYTTEVSALLPMIARLNPAGLHALRRLLENPDHANGLLQNLSRLDPELVNRLRTLDRPSRELLLALSND